MSVRTAGDISIRRTGVCTSTRPENKLPDQRPSPHRDLVKPDVIWDIAICALGRCLGCRNHRLLPTTRFLEDRDGPSACSPPEFSYWIGTAECEIGDVDLNMSIPVQRVNVPVSCLLHKSSPSMPVYPSPFPRSSASHSQDAEVISRTDPNDKRDTTKKASTTSGLK